MGGSGSSPKCLLHTYVLLSCNFLHHVNHIQVSSFLGVNVEQELPSHSYTHLPKTAQGCSLFLPEASSGPAEVCGSAAAHHRNLSSGLQGVTGARWWETGLLKKLFCRRCGLRKMQLYYLGLTLIHSISRGMPQRRHHSAPPVLQTFTHGSTRSSRQQNTTSIRNREVFYLLD